MFTKELNYIKSQDIKDFTKNILDRLPTYFYEVPASSTGKYHPNYALGKGGLVRHTIAAVNIAYDLLYRNDMFQCFKEDADYIISALILHDGCKSGLVKSDYTVTEHPIIVCDLIKKEQPCDIADKVCELIKSHMGQWNSNYRTGQEVLPKPSTKIQSFVHMCDYLASRKFLEFNFDAI